MVEGERELVEAGSGHSGLMSKGQAWLHCSDGVGLDWFGYDFVYKI